MADEKGSEIYRLAVLVSKMRAKQKEYFRRKDNGVLSEAKELEALVDRAVAWVLKNREEGQDGGPDV